MCYYHTTWNKSVGQFWINKQSSCYGSHFVFHRMPKINWKLMTSAVFKLPLSQKISFKGYNVNLQTAMAAILIFVECSKSIMFVVLLVQRPYQNVKSIWQAVFKLPHSQEISCIGYNVNLQTAVVAILIFVECLKSIASEVLMVLRPYQNVKSIRQEVFKLPHS